AAHFLGRVQLAEARHAGDVEADVGALHILGLSHFLAPGRVGKVSHVGDGDLDLRIDVAGPLDVPHQEVVDDGDIHAAQKADDLVAGIGQGQIRGGHHGGQRAGQEGALVLFVEDGVDVVQ